MRTVLKLGVGCNADVTCLFVLFGRTVTTAGAAAATKAIATTTGTRTAAAAAASGTAIAWTLSYFRQMPNVP